MSVTLTLQRIRQTSNATFGEFRDATGQRICYSLERPWLNNQHGVSCIPAGSYAVVWRWSRKHGRNVWGLVDVPDRSDIEIHPANDARELEGCLAPGTELGEVCTERFGDGYGVRHSDAALGLLNAAVGSTDPWTLVVCDVAHTASPVAA